MKKLIFILPLILLCFSCKKNILDLQPLDRISEDVVWSDPNLVHAYHTELYNSIPHGFGTHMLSKYTDEAVNTVPSGQGPYIFEKSTWTPDNINSDADNNTGFIDFWPQAYKYIRKIDVFMEQMSQNKVALSDKAQLIAEAKFLRAYIYFNLFERYGGVPIVEQSYILSDVTGSNAPSFKRATNDETVAYIDKNLTEAIPGLPQKYSASDANFGRATKDACLALRSRLYLYYASPLFNPTNDLTRWQKASDAAAALLNSGYSLYPDYRLSFNRPSGAANDELIFARNFTTSNGHSEPMNNLGRRYQAYGGWWASNGPSQNLVDDYDMTSGLPAFNVSGSGASIVKTVNAPSGYDATKPYVNRDPRFDATIIHDETTYHGDFFEMWVSSDSKTWGMDSYKTSSDNPRSNYELKKFMPDADVPLNWQTTYTQPWPIFRLGEIYLNYAEAQFELGNEQVARDYINKIRARPSVNMPAILPAVTGAALRARLYNERRIELAFEAHRFWDIRRWKIAIDIENRSIYGMDIFKSPAGVKTYTPFVMLTKTYTDNMNLIPIETAEIRRNPNLTQTPGW